MSNGDKVVQEGRSGPEQDALQQQLADQLEVFRAASDKIIVQKLEELKSTPPPSAKVESQKKGKSLNDYLEFIRFFTTNASTVNRSLALGGIAIVWIFKKPDSLPAIHKGLLNGPLLLLTLSLALDLLQYFFGAIAWKIFYERKYWVWKHKKQFENEYALDIQAPNWISLPLYLFWLFKIASMIIAYIALLQYLARQL